MNGPSPTSSMSDSAGRAGVQPRTRSVRSGGCGRRVSADLYVPFSLRVTLGQDYLPRRVGTAGGITLGLAVSIGGIAGPVIGAVAVATSLQTALAPLIVLPAVGWVLLRTLNEAELLDTATGRPSATTQEKDSKP